MATPRVSLDSGRDDQQDHGCDVAARTTSRTCLLLNRSANLAPRSDVAIAVTTWGRNMAPYWVLLRSYSVGSVKIELAAGKVTKEMPWTSPARLTTWLSALYAMSWVRRPQAVSVLVLVAFCGRSSTMCGMSSPWSAQASRSGVAAVASMVAAWSRSK
jgi:hypothetical protein